MVAVLVIVAETYRGRRNRANVHSQLDTDIAELREKLEQFVKTAPQDNAAVSITDRARTQFDTPEDGKYEALSRSVAALWKLAEQYGWTPSPEELAKELRWTLSAGSKNSEDESSSDSSHE